MTFGRRLAKRLLLVLSAEKRPSEAFLRLAAGVVLCGVPLANRLMVRVHFCFHKEERGVFRAQNGGLVALDWQKSNTHKNSAPADEQDARIIS